MNPRHYFAASITRTAHAGYIMYVTDPAQSATDVESLREAMRNSKGLGNFKTCFSTLPAETGRHQNRATERSRHKG